MRSTINGGVLYLSLQSESEVKAQKKQQSQQSEDQKTSPQVETASATPATNPTSEEGPRQRLHPKADVDNGVAASPGANVSTVPPTVNRATIQTNPADIPQQSRGAVRFGTLVLIWLLLLIIGALLVRRIYIMAY
jgi:hypothetical protein